MTVHEVDRPAFDRWVDGLIAKTRVIGVQAKVDRFEFRPLAAAADLRLDYDVTIIPPSKSHLLPPHEDLLTFKGNRYEGVFDTDPFVLMGVHPYDAIAIDQMDALFRQDNLDNHYMARRNAATIVAADVQAPSPNVFAGGMRTATMRQGRCDMLITKVGDRYLLETRTDKGKALLDGAEFPTAGEASLARREQVWDDNDRLLRKHTLKPPLDGLSDLLEKNYDHPVWDEKSALCFSCGSCNTTCPTCYCFDVKDDVNWDLQSGRRFRKWDACLLKDFATVAGDHNFRKTRTARYRHRYFRKGHYVPHKIGEVACVGCGRCITACVAKIANPVEVFNRLLEDK